MASVPAGRLSIEIVAEIARLQKDLEAAKRAVKAASNDIGASARAANDNIAGMGAAMAGVNRVSGAMRANMVNLSRQATDVAQGFALGQAPMQIFLQQGFQISEALAMMAAEAKATDTSLTRMAAGGLAKIGPYALAVGALVGAFALLADEVNENAEVQVSWSNVALGAFDVVSAAVNDQVTAAFVAMGIDVAKVWETVVSVSKTALNVIIGATSVVPRFIGSTFSLIGPAIGEAFYAAADLAKAAFNVMAQAAANTVNSITKTLNDAFGTEIPRVVAMSFDRSANPFAGAMSRLGSAGAGALVDTFTRDFVGEYGDAVRSAAVARQLGQSTAEAGKAAGKAGGKAAGAAMADELPKAFLEALKQQEDLASKAATDIAKAFGDNAKRIRDEDEARQRLNASYNQTIKDMQRELQLLNLTGDAREQRIRDFEREDFFEANKGLEGLNEKWEQYIRLRDELRARQGVLDEEGANIQRLAGQLEGLAGLLPGRAGQALGGLLNLEIGVRDGEAEKLSEAITRTFPGLAQTIGRAFEGAQIGGAAGSLLGALGIRTSNTGSQLGGAIGSFAGPLGSIAGGLLGGIVGGLLKSTPRASATIEGIAGEAMQTAVRGSSGKLKDIATGLANGLIGGLSQIASQLGGQLGSFGAISIGVRNDTFRVDPTGQGKTKGLQQFATEEEAIREALRIAISRGAITGIREGAQALLRAGGDLETQLQKALAFESVFDRLAEATDPLAFALGNLDKEFAALRDIFDEAQASTADYAALEQLYQIERGKITEQFTEQLAENTDAIRERMGLEARLLELQGDAAGALAIARELELRALDPANQEIARQIFALEDQAEALRIATEASEALAQAEAAIAQERFGLETRLLQLQGDTAALRERELAALDPANRAILDRIFRLEDEQAALQAANEAAAELARIQDAIAQERFGIEGQILSLLGDTVAIRERELAAVDPSNRALLERLFRLQDEQAALEASAAAQEEAARASEALAQEALRAADALAQAQRAIASEIAGLNRQLLQAQGNTAALRELDLAGLLSDEARAIQSQIFAIEDARAAQEALAEAQAEAARTAETLAEETRRAYEEALRSAQDALRQAVAAERSDIEARLDPLRSELERLVSAVTPEATDITAALEIRDFLTDGLSLAAKLADASRGVLGDTERVITAQRELARRELFRMVETRQINEGILDRLIGDATNFGDEFATRVDLQREQGRTAGLLAELAKVAEENAKAAQAAEDARAAEARDQVLAQIEALQSQISIGEAQLATLDATLERFGLLNDSVLSVADAVRQLEGVTRQAFGIAAPGAVGGVGGGVTTGGGGPLDTSTGTSLSTDVLRQINNLLLADQERRAANGLFGGFMGAIDPAMFEALVSGELVAAGLSLATLANSAQAILAMAGGDISQAGSIISGPLPQDTSQFAAAPATAEEIAALKAEQEKTNEYLRELVKVNHKQERDLKELVIQGEAV